MNFFIKSFFSLFAFLFVFSSSIFAYSASGTYYSIKDPICTSATCSALLVSDDIPTSSGSAYLYVRSSTTLSIPAGATVTGVSIRMRGYHTGGALTGGGMSSAILKNDNGTSCVFGATDTFTKNAQPLPNSPTFITYEQHNTSGASYTTTTGNLCLTVSLSWSAGGFNAMDYIEAAVTYTQPACASPVFTDEEPASDVFAWIGWSFKKTLFDLFTPNYCTIQSDYDTFYSSVSGRAPFAYFAPLTSISFSTTSAHILPSFTIPLSRDGTTDFTFNPSDTPDLQENFDTIMGYIGGFLWVGWLFAVISILKQYFE